MSMMPPPAPSSLQTAPTSFAPPVSGALDIIGFCKRFDQKVAVNNLSLSIPKGSFFGLVGPNGAGKTTTLRMATGLLRPDTGQARIDGVDVWPDPAGVKSRMGLVPDGLLLFERLSGREMLLYAGLLRGMAEAEVTARAEELLSVLGLSDDADKLIVDYSHGMRKKTALACALLHRPPVLVLDEPFEGIDPVSAVNMRTVLERYTGSGGTVVMSSHIMDLVERMCDHVAVITNGQIVANGPIAALRNGGRLEDAFIHLVGGSTISGDSLSWLGQQGS
jgi:ABC-2 type transport system ATP-binding protein